MTTTTASCQGSYLFGSACGLCARCQAERNRLDRATDPRRRVTEEHLDQWEASVTDVQLMEILRLARVGLRYDRHAVPIAEALKLAVGELLPARVPPFQKALDELPKEAK